MPILELPDHELSNSAARRTKHWIKQLTGVDTTKQDGFAFEGQFRDFEETVEVPVGAMFLSYIEDTRGSGRVDGRFVTLWVAREENLEVVQTWTLDAGRGWALKIRDQVAHHLAAAASEPAATEALAWVPDVPTVRQMRDTAQTVQRQLDGRFADLDAHLDELIETMNKMLGGG